MELVRPLNTEELREMLRFSLDRYERFQALADQALQRVVYYQELLKESGGDHAENTLPLPDQNRAEEGNGGD